VLMGMEAPSARAEARAGQVFVKDRLIPIEEVRAQIEAVTPEDLQKLAQYALTGPACAASVGPKAGHAALDAFHQN